MRNHPSVIAFMIGSDTEPPPDVAADVRRGAARGALARSRSWRRRPGGTPLVLGPTGVKMTGPYDWVPPGLLVRRPRVRGGAVGFNTETSAGAVDPRDSRTCGACSRASELRALWTEPSHAAVARRRRRQRVQDFALFDRAMAARIGRPTGLADFVRKAQVMQYENERAMFEAFSANRPTAPDVIQWMLNNAWPSLHWNLFDWYLEPNGSTFGAKKANEPLHVQYSYDDRSSGRQRHPSRRCGLTATPRCSTWTACGVGGAPRRSTSRPTPRARRPRRAAAGERTSSYLRELRLSSANGASSAERLLGVDRDGATVRGPRRRGS